MGPLHLLAAAQQESICQIPGSVALAHSPHLPTTTSLTFEGGKERIRWPITAPYHSLPCSFCSASNASYSEVRIPMPSIQQTVLGSPLQTFGDLGLSQQVTSRFGAVKYFKQVQ